MCCTQSDTWKPCTKMEMSSSRNFRHQLQWFLKYHFNEIFFTGCFESGAVSDENFAKMTFPFQYDKCSWIILTPTEKWKQGMFDEWLNLISKVANSPFTVVNTCINYGEWWICNPATLKRALCLLMFSRNYHWCCGSISIQDILTHLF